MFAWIKKNLFWTGALVGIAAMLALGALLYFNVVRAGEAKLRADRDADRDARAAIQLKYDKLTAADAATQRSLDLANSKVKNLDAALGRADDKNKLLGDQLSKLIGDAGGIAVGSGQLTEGLRGLTTGLADDQRLVAEIQKRSR